MTTRFFTRTATTRRWTETYIRWTATRTATKFVYENSKFDDEIKIKIKTATRTAKVQNKIKNKNSNKKQQGFTFKTQVWWCTVDEKKQQEQQQVCEDEQQQVCEDEEDEQQHEHVQMKMNNSKWIKERLWKWRWTQETNTMKRFWSVCEDVEEERIANEDEAFFQWRTTV